MCSSGMLLQLAEDGLSPLYSNLWHRNLCSCDPDQYLCQTVNPHPRSLVDADALELLTWDQPGPTIEESASSYDGLRVDGPALLSPVQPGRRQRDEEETEYGERPRTDEGSTEGYQDDGSQYGQSHGSQQGSEVCGL